MKTAICTALLGGLLCGALPAQSFMKITDAANPVTSFTSAYLYVGAAWVDVDNDGDVDLYSAPDRLFENLGGGNFKTKNTLIGSGLVPGNWLYAGASWADVDNDGDLDCYLGAIASALYLNNGAGLFTKHNQAPVNGNKIGWTGALGDYNGDQRMDIALAYPNSAAGSHSYLFASDGPLSWKSIAGLEFTDQPAPYTTAAWADFDDDGDFDLFSASGPAIVLTAGPDYIYRNELAQTGTATLTRVLDLPFAAELQDGQSYSFIDYDNDGHLDICLANYGASTNIPNRLYHNNGNGTWTSVSAPFTAAALKNCLANAWGDYDNDGDLDVIFTRDGGNPARLYWNDGAGGFALDAGNAISKHQISTGISIGDYDNDGDLDAFLNGRTDKPGQGRALFRNDLANGNHWISFKLVGKQSNRSAIGAKVRVRATVGGQSKWLRRDVSAQNTFQGQNDLRVHFGLGDAEGIDSLVVWFPSGTVTTCGAVAAGQFYTVEEQAGPWSQCATPTTGPAGAAALAITPNPAGDEIRLSGPEAAPELEVQIFNAAGHVVLRQVFSEKIDTAALPPGVYAVFAKGGGQAWAGRFVKI